MADKTTEQGTQTTQPQTTDTAPDKGGQQAAQSFTQGDVDRLIGETRISERRKFDKEKADYQAQFKDYDDLKKAASEWRKVEDAKKTEMEKLTERLSTMEAQYAEAQSQNARLAQERAEALIRSAIVAKATGLQFRDPTDAWRMIDLAALTLKDDGTVDNLEAQLEALSKSKPYLLQSAQADQTQPQPRISPTNPGRGHEQGETDAQRRQRLYGYGGTPIGGAQGGGLHMPKSET